jgi:exodeoxyribonuclease VII small subunit
MVLIPMAKKTEPSGSFEDGLEELEKIVGELESGEAPLEKSLELFERGVKLSEACRARLEQAETRVEVLLKKGRKLEAEPFELDDAEGAED